MTAPTTRSGLAPKATAREQIEVMFALRPGVHGSEARALGRLLDQCAAEAAADALRAAREAVTEHINEAEFYFVGVHLGLPEVYDVGTRKRFAELRAAVLAEIDRALGE